MVARTRRGSLLAMIGALAALTSMIGAQAAESATSYESCGLAQSMQQPPGGTPTYNLSLKEKNASCATAKKVMKAFHRCRTESGYRCATKVLTNWTCIGRKDSSTSTLFYGTFTCTWGRRRVKSSYQQNTPGESRSAPSVGTSAAATPKCRGAAERDPKRPCVNPTRSVYPAPDEVDRDPGAGCAPFDEVGCWFGVREASATGHFALVGDSHTYHWRAALNIVANAKSWRGYSISAGGCYFSQAVDSFFEGPREPCIAWYRSVLAWFRDHPEVSTVFVTQNADTPIVVAPGQTQSGVKVAGFRRAWQALPPTVKHVIVLRDTPASSQATLDCVRRVSAAGTERPGPACPLRRSVALRDDTAVAAVLALHSKRYQYIDLTEFFCSPRNCYPVIGGVLVNRDIFGHITVSYARTLGPYLFRKVRKLMASW